MASSSGSLGGPSSLSVGQLLLDARRLSLRLREHDADADTVIAAAQGVLKEVEAMKQYQEDLDQLNALAHQRPRAKLVLGIQQENRHIRQLQQENKELRAALEEHQNALELIMSKYRQHMSFLVHTTKLDKNLINHQKSVILQEKTDQICEMANVMQSSIQLDEEFAAKEREIKTRLVTENKGLREMLEISQRNGSHQNPLLRPRLVSRDSQTDDSCLFPPPAPPPSMASPSGSSPRPPHQQAVVQTSSSSSSLLPTPAVKTSSTSDDLSPSSPSSGSSPRSPSRGVSSRSPCNGGSAAASASASVRVSASSPSSGFSLSSDSSEDDEVTFNTIKRSAGKKISARITTSYRTVSAPAPVATATVKTASSPALALAVSSVSTDAEINGTSHHHPELQLHHNNAVADENDFEEKGEDGSNALPTATATVTSMPTTTEAVEANIQVPNHHQEKNSSPIIECNTSSSSSYKSNGDNGVDGNEDDDDDGDSSNSNMLNGDSSLPAGDGDGDGDDDGDHDHDHELDVGGSGSGESVEESAAVALLVKEKLATVADADKTIVDVTMVAVATETSPSSTTVANANANADCSSPEAPA